MDAEVFKKHVLGKKVVGVKHDVPTGANNKWGYGPENTGRALVLEDGTLLNVYMSDQDCCAQADGIWTTLSDPNFHGGITNIEIREEKNVDYYDGRTSTATITVLHGNDIIAKNNMYADSGSGGFYFSILSLQVIVPDGKIVHEEEVMSSY